MTVMGMLRVTSSSVPSQHCYVKGCGAAIVGDPDQVLAKIEAYRAVGIEAFILSGYPHINECDMFARYVLPRLEHGRLAV